MGKITLEKDETDIQKLNATPSFDDADTQKTNKSKRRRILRNLVFYCLSYLLQFASHNGLLNLQSSLNSDKNLGVHAMITSTLAFAATCLYLPSLLNKYAGYKWPLVGCHVLICSFVLANFMPNYWTFLPTAALTGASMGVLWTYQGSFIVELATQYVSISKTSIDTVLLKFFGIFGVIFQFSKTKPNINLYFKLSTKTRKRKICENFLKIIP